MNIFKKCNTQNLKYTLPTSMPFESTFYYNHPHYLNTASIPFMSAELSYPDYNKIKYGSQNIEYSQLSTYTSSMSDEEAH